MISATPIATYREFPLHHVKVTLFDDVYDVKERYAMDRHMQWEHTWSLSEHIAMFSPIQELDAHAIFDVRVHAPNAPTAVQLTVGSTVLPFTQCSSGNYWILPTFTWYHPLMLLPLNNKQLQISVTNPTDTRLPWSISIACYRFTQECVRRLHTDFFMDTRSKRKLVFCDYFTIVEDPSSDPTWKWLPFS